MIPPEKITPKQLLKILVEKHQKFLENYEREFNILERLNMLNEKQEQLKYWIGSIGSDEESPTYQKYLNEKKLADIEITGLKEEIKKFRPDGIITNKNRFNWLEQQIHLHKDAIDYWNSRYKDLAAVRRKTDERKGAEGTYKHTKTRDRQKKQ